MEFLNKLLRRPALAPAAGQTHVVTLERAFINQPALEAASKRKGMWVHVTQGTGIITGCRVDGLAEVTLVKDDGSTRMTLDYNDKAVPEVVVCELASLRQAYIHEIPESRRGDIMTLRAMGYTNGGA